MMGISYSDLIKMSEYDLSLFRIGYQKRQEQEWQRTRFQSWIILSAISSATGGKNIDIEDVMPLPSDQDRKKEKPVKAKSIKVNQDVFNGILKKLGKNGN